MIDQLLKSTDMSEVENLLGFDKSESMKYIYLVNRTNNYEVSLRKYGIRVLFASDKLEQAKLYRNYVYLYVSNGGDVSNLIKPSKEYRGLGKSKKSSKSNKSNELDYVDNVDHYLVVSKNDDQFSVRFTKSRKDEMLAFIEDSNNRLKNGAKLNQLRKVSQFESGQYDCLEEQFTKIDLIRQRLHLLKEFHGDLKAPKNSSGERYITKNDQSNTSYIWRVYIKLGNRILADVNCYSLVEARTERRRIIQFWIPRLELEIDYLLEELNNSK